MFKAVVGHGLDPDSEGAIQEALEQCTQALAGEKPSAGILISAADFEHESVIHAIRQAYPDILLIGGTSVGEISSAMGFQEDSLALMLFCSDEVEFQIGVGKKAGKNEIAAAQAAIDQAKPADGIEAIKLCYALCDGLSVDGVEIVNGLKTATEGISPIIGGLTADDWQFKNTYQFISSPTTTEILKDAIVVLTFAGNLKVSCGVASGQRPIGPKAVITRSEGSTIYEIDDAPARNFYTSTLGVSEVQLAGGGGWSGSLGVREVDSDRFYVRSPNGEGHTDGSISYFGNIPNHSVVQLVETDNNSLLASVKEATQTALDAYPGESPSTALVISCASRLKALGTRTEQEHALTAECLGHEVPILGFHSYGEIGPFAQQTTAHFHNETFVALLLGTH